MINVCTIPGPTAAGCAGKTAVTPADGEGYVALAQPTPGNVLLTNGSANFTELFTSADGGASYVNTQNLVALPDGKPAARRQGQHEPGQRGRRPARRERGQDDRLQHPRVLIATTSQGQVLVAKLDGTTFGTPKDISGPGTDTGYLPNITQDATGRITATWQGSYVATRIYANLFLSLSPTQKTIKQGASAKLTAKLVDEHNAGIPGAKITLRAGKKTVATATTSSAGTVSFTVKPKQGTTDTGTAVNSSYVSQITEVKVKKAK